MIINILFNDNAQSFNWESLELNFLPQNGKTGAGPFFDLAVKSPFWDFSRWSFGTLVLPNTSGAEHVQLICTILFLVALHRCKAALHRLTGGKVPETRKLRYNSTGARLPCTARPVHILLSLFKGNGKTF